MICVVKSHSMTLIVYFRRRIRGRRLDVLRSRIVSITSSCQVITMKRCLSFRTFKFIFPTLFTRLSVDRFHCDICEYAKNKRTNFPISKSRSLAPFHLVHSDVWGSSTIPNISGALFFISFIDDCTRVTWAFLMKNKSDVSHIVPNFFNMVKTQFE